MYNNIDSYYKVHSKLYDLTRWSFLFGRNRIHSYLPVLPANARILDLGCGTGRHIQQLEEHYPEAEIIAIDRSPEMIQKAISKSNGQVSFMQEIYNSESFKEASFDLILSSYSLTMMEQQHAGLEAIKHHLKPNGHLLVVDFYDTSLGWFKKWMSINFVSFSRSLFDRLHQQYQVKHFQSHSAFLGLWQYGLFVGHLK